MTLAFELSGPRSTRRSTALGAMPLPPYIASRRPAGRADRSDYQTIFAREEGAVAAPTAGPAFHRALMQALDARGVSRHFVTLHVGAGTFLPVRAADTAEHVMHAEHGSIAPRPPTALNAVKARGGRIVAVGTTSLRLLESATGRRWQARALLRRDESLHHAGLSLPLRRSAADQFPSAALDPVHAGRGLRRARSDEARLCACDRASAIASIPTAMPACSARRPGHERALLLHAESARRRGAHRRHRHAARRSCARRPSCRSAPAPR